MLAVAHSFGDLNGFLRNKLLTDVCVRCFVYMFGFAYLDSFALCFFSVRLHVKRTVFYITGIFSSESFARKAFDHKNERITKGEKED